MVEIVDTYAEAFEGICSRIILTAKEEKILKKAACGSTALPSTVIGRLEGGIEKWLEKDQTPDGRQGAILQFWGQLEEGRLENSINRFYKEFSYRIRQGILVLPTTAVYNALDSKEQIDIMDRIGHCGDGYEYEAKFCGRNVVRIPLMMGEFTIERYLGYCRGIMGGNIWLMCKNEDAALEAGDKALEAISKVDGTVTPFDVCSAGSKVETKYPEIGPTTNHPFCPTLRNKISDSQVPEDVNSIPEIVINGLNMPVVRMAMKSAIKAMEAVRGVIRISAGNYGGRLGQYKIFLRELV